MEHHQNSYSMGSICNRQPITVTTKIAFSDSDMDTGSTTCAKHDHETRPGPHAYKHIDAAGSEVNRKLTVISPARELKSHPNLEELVRIQHHVPHLFANVETEDKGKVKTISDMIREAQNNPNSTEPAKPAVTSIVVTKGQLEPSEERSLENIQLLTTFINSYSSALMYHKRPGGYNISDATEAAEFVNAYANELNRVISESMSTYLSVRSVTTQSFSRDVNQQTLHIGFLDDIFKSFNLSQPSMDMLDGVLTKAFSALSDISTKTESTANTVNNVIFTYFFEPVQGLPNVVVPKLRMFFLKIDSRSWEQTVKVGKSSGTRSKISFHMNYFDSQYEMNEQLVQADNQKIKDVIESLTGSNFTKIKDMMSVISAEQAKQANNNDPNENAGG